MTKFIGKETRILIQGITGTYGRRSAKEMLIFGNKILAGVTPGKAGQTVESVPVFDSIKEALSKVGQIDVSVVFVPAAVVKSGLNGKKEVFWPAKNAIIEAIDAKIPIIVCVTEGIPVWQTMEIKTYIETFAKGIRLFGPSSGGIAVPNECKITFLPSSLFQKKGEIAVFSKSSSIFEKIVTQLKKVGLNLSLFAGIGGDAIIGTDFVDMLKIVRDDSETQAVIIVGEPGGRLEQEAAAYAAETNYPKGLLFFLAGTSPPITHQSPYRSLGHAGNFTGQNESISDKMEYIKNKGFEVCLNILEIGEDTKKKLKS